MDMEVWWFWFYEGVLHCTSPVVYKSILIFNTHFSSAVSRSSFHIRKPQFPMDWTLLVDVVYAVSLTFCVFKLFLVSGSLQTSLLCIVGKLAGEGSLAVAVSVSERWQVMQHTAYDRCNLKTWYLEPDTCFPPFCPASVSFGICATIRTLWKIHVSRRSSPW